MPKTAVLALLIAFLGMGAALKISANTFDRLPQLEDEYTYTYQAKIFARGNIVIDTPEPRRASWQPFVLDINGHRFGKYPPGWPLLLAIGYLFNLPSVINAWLGMLSLVITYRLAAEIFNRVTGVIAAFLLFISPIALLQNGTLMAHTASLFFTMLFLLGMWRLEKQTHLWRWGMIAGGALGMLIAIRPIVAVSIGAPLVAYSAIRLLVALVPSEKRRLPSPWWGRLLIHWIPIVLLTIFAYWVAAQLPFWPNWPVLALGASLGLITLAYVVYEIDAEQVNPLWPSSFKLTLLPLLWVIIFTLLLGALLPIYNYNATGKPFDNLYTYIWKYDTLGFGPTHGRYGHTWDKAKQILQKDMACYSRDLFGIVAQPDNPPDRPIAPSTADPFGNECVIDNVGLSWLLLPLGFVLGWRRRWSFVLWGVAVSIIFASMFYWIGAAVYSARYYYEATGILAIITAFAISEIARFARPLKFEIGIYALVVIVGLMSLFGYSGRRLAPLENRYTVQSRLQLAGLERHRQHPDQPLLVIAYGHIHWRKINALMALTSPYQDSDIVLVRDPDKLTFFELEGMFPDREILYYTEDGQWLTSPFESGGPLGRAQLPSTTLQPDNQVKGY